MIRYSDDLPLRTAAVWPGFRTPAIIPLRYGRTGGACLQYNAGRTSFVWADHAVGGIEDVLVDGIAVSNWQARNAPDNTGRTVSLIEFDGPIPEGSNVVARGRGKLSERTGQLLESPADVVHDLVTAVAGRTLPFARLAAFRSACDAAALVVGGSVSESVTLQTAIRSVCASVGALFAPDAREMCHLWPAPPAGARAHVDVRHGLTARVALADLATAIVLRYAHEDGTATSTVELEAREPVARFGRRVVEIDCPWVRSARVAVAVGTRILQHRSRPVWRVGVSGVPGDLRVGDGVDIDHPRLPSAGVHTITSRVYNLADDSSSGLDFEVPVGAVPRVRVVGQSSMLGPEQYTSATIETSGTEYLLTLREQDGKAIAFASATLDGQITRISDGAGRVTFPASAMPPGDHVIDILTTDGRTLSMTVPV